MVLIISDLNLDICENDVIYKDGVLITGEILLNLYRWKPLSKKIHHPDE